MAYCSRIQLPIAPQGQTSIECKKKGEICIDIKNYISWNLFNETTANVYYRAPVKVSIKAGSNRLDTFKRPSERCGPEQVRCLSLSFGGRARAGSLPESFVVALKPMSNPWADPLQRPRIADKSRHRQRINPKPRAP